MQQAETEKKNRVDVESGVCPVLCFCDSQPPAEVKQCLSEAV